MMQERAIAQLFCHQQTGTRQKNVLDKVACESMLSIDIIAGPSYNRCTYSFATLLRTPGFDEELVLGLLYSLAIIDSSRDLISLSPCFRGMKDQKAPQTITVELNYDKKYSPLDFSHAHARYASCGICGSTSELRVKSPCHTASVPPPPTILFESLAKITAQQAIFNETGGTHGAALFSLEGSFIALFEDVGRHNALDKLIGHMLLKNALPLRNSMLLITSRASYEIVQKASMAGIPIIAAMGAVSSLAIEMAQEHNIILIGFLRDERFTIYSGNPLKSACKNKD